MLLVGYVSLKFLIALLSWNKLLLKAVNELKLHYAILGSILFLSILSFFLPTHDVFEPVAKVWSAESINMFSEKYHNLHDAGMLSVDTPTGTRIVDTNVFFILCFIFFTLTLLIGGFLLVQDLRNLARIKRRSFRLRKISGVSIYANDEVQVPFSYWCPGQTNVIIPTSMIYHASHYRMALAHELQHHRQGDTKWVYVLLMLKFVCIINPIIYLWNRWIIEIQEFACDETLVDQHKVESQAYANCLVEAAQTAINQKAVSVCASGLTFLVESHILKRRIDKMFNKKKKQIGRSISTAIAVGLVCLMGATSYAAKGLVQDRRVSMAQARTMVDKAQRETGIPIVVNDLVLQQLNRYIGTPEGREFMRESLKRMENYRAMVNEKIKEYNMPSELMAVPLVESGYQNLAQSDHKGWGAGLWMFIASTARVFGLKVDDKIDERLNEVLLTDAAMRYLGSNYLRFKDWHLALLAYNIGESRVQKAIEQTGSHDAWVLIRKGYQNDQDYLPKVMAAMIIMRNPNSVE
ncbi:MAG: transglycosylase SLT domain-containing protein [Bdellovibrionaceae bacterium]|nr:transglycosylase SLT domain-containing protein [Pseudobdellovibrionaceae bacterium]